MQKSLSGSEVTYAYIQYVPVASFAGAGVPPHGMGLIMEGRGHTLRHVGNSVISIHHEAHFMKGAATIQETSYNTWFEA